jgi:hypothetical protein
MEFPANPPVAESCGRIGREFHAEDNDPTHCRATNTVRTKNSSQSSKRIESTGLDFRPLIDGGVFVDPMDQAHPVARFPTEPKDGVGVGVLEIGPVLLAATTRAMPMHFRPAGRTSMSVPVDHYTASLRHVLLSRSDGPTWPGSFRAQPEDLLLR